MLDVKELQENKKEMQNESGREERQKDKEQAKTAELKLVLKKKRVTEGSSKMCYLRCRSVSRVDLEQTMQQQIPYPQPTSQVS